MTTTFKIGQQIYSINTLDGGMVTKIEYQKDACVDSVLKCFITFTCDKTGKEIKNDSRFLTNDYKKVIRLCKEQIQEYKEAFFRQKQANDCLLLNGVK